MRLLHIVTLSTLALLLSACGSSDAKPAPENTTQPPRAAAPSTPAPEPADEVAPAEAVDQLQHWLELVNNAKGAEACAMLTPEFAKTVIDTAVSGGEAKSGSSCSDVLSANDHSGSTYTPPTVTVQEQTADAVVLNTNYGYASSQYAMSNVGGTWKISGAKFDGE